MSDAIEIISQIGDTIEIYTQDGDIIEVGIIETLNIGNQNDYFPYILPFNLT